MRYVADGRKAAKLLGTLRFLPNTPEATFFYVLYTLRET